MMMGTISYNRDKHEKVLKQINEDIRSIDESNTPKSLVNETAEKKNEVQETIPAKGSSKSYNKRTNGFIKRYLGCILSNEASNLATVISALAAIGLVWVGVVVGTRQLNIDQQQVNLLRSQGQGVMIYAVVPKKAKKAFDQFLYNPKPSNTRDKLYYRDWWYPYYVFEGRFFVIYRNTGTYITEEESKTIISGIEKEEEKYRLKSTKLQINYKPLSNTDANTSSLVKNDVDISIKKNGCEYEEPGVIVCELNIEDKDRDKIRSKIYSQLALNEETVKNGELQIFEKQ